MTTPKEPRPPLPVPHEAATVGDIRARLMRPIPLGQAHGADAGAVDPLFGALLALVGRRLSDVGASHAAAVLLHHILRTAPIPEGWVYAARRQVAKETDLTAWAVRRALDHLLQCGWLERRAAARNTPGYYRVTRAFAEAVKAADAALHHTLRDRLAWCLKDSGSVSGIAREPGDTACATLPPAVCHASERDLMRRLFALNDQRRRYGGAYSKGMIRTGAAVLHRLIQADASAGEDALTVSLRGLARDTGLTFRSVRRARARLIAWGVLTEHAGAYRLDRDHLLYLLYHEDAELPAPARTGRKNRTRSMD